jgi:hypothetical protein
MKMKSLRAGFESLAMALRAAVFSCVLNIKQALPRLCALALLTVLLGCAGTSEFDNPGRNLSLAKGIPSYGATKLDFPSGRNRAFRVEISEPVIVAVASGPQG